MGASARAAGDAHRVQPRKKANLIANATDREQLRSIFEALIRENGYSVSDPGAVRVISRPHCADSL
jgi:hypothetical protein